MDVPIEFWERDEVKKALAARDIGGLFRLVRQHAGASQTTIGIAVGMPQGQISTIMSTGPRQRRISAYAVLERIADGLRIPDHGRQLLGLATQTVKGGDDPQDPDPWSLAAALTRSSIDAAIMDRFERLVLVQAMRYPSTPPTVMWPTIRQELQRAEAALAERQTLSIQRRLVNVIGTLSGIAGNLSVDLGRPARALEYFDVSWVAADEAANNDLAAWSLALQSIDPFFRGYGDEAASLLDQAAELADSESSARRRAWVAALRARAHAAAGNASTAAQALESAYAAIDQAEPKRNGTDFFDRDRLDGIAGTTYLLMRDTERATALISAATDRRPYADAKGRALLTLELAACHLIDQEPDEVVALIGEALDIADGQIVRPIMMRSRELRSRMGTWRDTAAVKALDARLATLRDLDQGK
ncbi:hypothetical protein ACTMTJ_29025 [Phytohabitans sp. LJ34]|uniref:hypothetical protein n=1 Tax=Phytohabitans sp. LJ34 TaxID=3452217 RepID=UPI003F8BDB5F